jgi:CRP-like cAMP-binding protein
MVADVLPPALGGELSATGGSLAELGEITSTTVVRRPLREHLRVDFHAVWDGDGAGRHEIAFRPLGEREAANRARAIGASPLALLPQALREELLRGARVVDLAQGDRLLTSLTEDRWMAVVVSGIVRLHLAGDPIEASLMYGRQGSLVGTHWSVPNQPIALGLQAVTQSSVLLLGARRFDALAATNEELARLLLDEGRAMLNDLVRLYGVRTCGTLAERLAREILLMSDLQGGSPFVPVTEQQLADAIGSIRESVGRALADLRGSAWLATTRYGLVILCRDSLARLASSAGI